MKDMFAELMAFLFAENRRKNPMLGTYSRRLLTNIKNQICTGKCRINAKEEGQSDEE